MRVVIGILGAMFFGLGLLQGLNLSGFIGSSSEAVQGWAGGGFPAVAGAFGALLVAFAMKPPLEVPDEE